MELDSLKRQPLIKDDTFSLRYRVWREVFFVAITVISLLFVISRLFLLQIVKGPYYKTVSDENRIRAVAIKAYRGVIKDRDGRVLVQNSPSFNVKVSKDAPDLPGVLKKLSLFIDTSNPLEIEDFLIFSGVDRDTGIKIESGFSDDSSIEVVADPQRDYLYPYEFAHLLGYVSFITPEEFEERKNLGYIATDRVGVLGVEKLYDNILRGEHGSSLYEYDASGDILREIAKKDPVSGTDLLLSVNLDLQLKSYAALKKAVEDTGATGGVVIAQQPQTGEILAFVNYPSFDPNLFSKGISDLDYNKIISDPLKPLFNRALAGQYPPGSVFKIVTASAVLSENIVTKDTLIQAPGAINIGSFVYRDWNPSGHGEVNVVRALAESADTFFYKVVGGYSDFGDGLGPDKLSYWANKFGLGKETEVGLDYESSGIIPTPSWKEKTQGEPWYIGDSYITAIGQGYVLSTPIQINQMTAVIANDGYLVRPRVSLNSGFDESGSKLPVISQTTLSVVKKGLQEACEPGGTGYPFFDFAAKHGGIQVGCKTGTSEFGEKNIWGEYQTHAWFTVFAPLDNAKIVLTVFLEGGGEGADAASPVAREILDWWFDRPK